MAQPDDKPKWAQDGAKRSAPAAARNRDALIEVLTGELPSTGAVLEIASGSGEHALWFAEAFPQLSWQPSDRTDDAIASATAWRADHGGDNLLKPVRIDAAQSDWPLAKADAVICINMIHIAPWSAAEGLFAGSARLLPKAAPLILYGPFFESEIEPAPSNVSFDESLRMRDASWGIRQREEVDALATKHGFSLSARYTMPANNLTLIYRKA